MAKHHQKPKRVKRVATRKPVAQASTKHPVDTPAGVSYESRCSWDECDLTELLGFDDTNPVISKVILRDGEIVFDWITDGQAVQHTKLFSSDGVSYSGFTVYARGIDTDRARFEATLYSNNLGHILVGQGVWEEEGRGEAFIIQLHSGKRLDND